MEKEKNVLKKKKINLLRQELNNSILENKDYSIIYDLSVQLDELIADYYREYNCNSTIKYHKENIH